MPYTHKKVGTKYVVYKGTKKVGETEGTKTALNKYLAALHIADKKTTKKEVKSLKESMIDMQMDPNQLGHPGCEDTVGKIFVVLKPAPGASPVDLVHPTHAFGMGQYDPQGVHGVYNDEEEANMVAESACNELHKHLTGVEKKKDQILDKITEKIAGFQKEINAHMKEATDNPELAEKHHQLAERKMQAIGALRGKHKMVKEAKKEVPQREIVKK